MAGAPEPLPSPDDLIGRMHPPVPEPEEEIYETKREGHPDTQVIFRHREHIHRYGFACAECHKEDNCNRCHESGKQHVQHVRTLAEHHRPCSACHDVETADRCQHCHYGEGEPQPPPFDHARTGWPLNRYHSNRTCRACHASTPFSARPQECGVCHGSWSPDTFNHAITGQVLDENHAPLGCEDCHAERRFDRPPVCSSCHEEGEGIAFPGKRPGPVVEP
jgi:DnaJ-class molecular chaperone